MSGKTAIKQFTCDALPGVGPNHLLISDFDTVLTDAEWVPVATILGESTEHTLFCNFDTGVEYVYVPAPEGHIWDWERQPPKWMTREREIPIYRVAPNSLSAQRELLLALVMAATPDRD